MRQRFLDKTFFTKPYFTEGKGNTMQKLAILGASFFDIIKLVDAINKKTPTWSLVGFIDDKENLQGTNFGGYKVLGGRDLIPALVKEDVYFIHNVAGDFKRITMAADLLDSYGCKVANLIHPDIDMNYVEIGHGCIFPEGTIIGGNTKIGNYVISRLRILISHDVTIEDYSFIGPGAIIGGNVVLQRGSYIGAGATIMQKRTVGAESIIGAGAVVTKDVAPNTVVAGVPAKVIRYNVVG
jgi:sugar O-acyltransferase (sialic acid O-acetyltransferase NeuD family)